MQKIISVFQRNYTTDRLIRNEVTPGAEWVLAGEGVATRKMDGACASIQGGELYKRYDAKQGRTPPAGFVPAQDPDEKTGHWPGWLKVGEGAEDRWFRAAHANALQLGELTDGTYEAVGPHFQGNPEQLDQDTLVLHGSVEYPAFPRGFDAIKGALAELDIEGVVFHHPDGRMAKVKKKDFGLKRGR